MERLRIGYLLSQFPAVNHTYLLREVQALRRLGVEIQVASIRPADRLPESLPPEEREQADGTYYIKTLGLFEVLRAHLTAIVRQPRRYCTGLCSTIWMGRHQWSTLFSLLCYFVEAVIVGIWMERAGLRHLHVHFSSTVGLIVARLFPVSVSMTFHGPAEFENTRRFWLREKIAASEFVRAISRYCRSQLMRHCDFEDWRKIELTPLGVDPAEFAPRPYRENPSPFQVVCVGRLASEKAQHVLIAALDRLVKSERNVVLRLVGDGADRASLERDVAARGLGAHVVFDGWLNQAELRAVYALADAFVLPSFAEGLPVVLMEAMAMEIPCITTHVTGVPELIESGIDGLLVPASDDRALAAAIERLMDDPELRRQLGTAARRRVIDEYNLPRNASLLAELFRARLLGQSSRAAA